MPVEMWESPAAFRRDFSKQLVGIRAFCGFPQMRHFHQATLIPIVFLPTDFAEDPQILTVIDGQRAVEI